MFERTRRGFLADVGRGMLVASLGPVVTSDLGLASAHSAEAGERLHFGELEPLVALMQETPADKLLPKLVEKIGQGAELKSLIAAGALANARTFGGQDYDGYHAFMALVPAMEMSKELPAGERAIPVLKVLYRNTARMQQQGGRTNEVLHPIPAAPVTETPDALRSATRAADMKTAESTFAGLAGGSLETAYEQLLHAVQDEIDVHRVVLAWRAWAMLDLTGQERAHTLLRQSVRFCVSSRDRITRNRPVAGIRALLPKLIDQYKLMGRTAGDRPGDDAWVEKLSQTIYGANRDAAAEAVAGALADGFSLAVVAEAMSLAANRLVLRDPGRSKDEAGKPKGSVHGASVGVHASDSANAWRNIARVGPARNAFSSLIVGAYHTAGQNHGQLPDPHPLAEQTAKVTTNDGATLLRDLDAAVRERDQARACALVQRYGDQGHPVRAVFDVLLKYAVSEDGALHAEKYYRTVCEEFAASRPAFRWRHLVGLARVTASESGFPAPGYAEARRLVMKNA